MVFKGSLYILNILCGIIPCEHNFQYPDSTPLGSQAINENAEDYEADVRTVDNTAWEEGGNGSLYNEIDYGKTHPLIVHSNTGKLKGYWMRVVGGRKIRAFEGIPYAEPPMKELRFKAPLPVKPWTGLLQANLKGPKCLQYNDIASSRVIGSENCLYLNVYSRLPSQNKKSSKKDPVLVVIHGAGSFTTGSGNDFGPAYLLQRDVVLVTINYRVGVLGFMSTSDEESPGNAGLKDQAEAIGWIYKNIEFFGGDKDRIILFGHGSGGEKAEFETIEVRHLIAGLLACVHFHMMSFRARGKFIAGMSISGTAFNQWALHTKDQALNLTKSFAKAIHCPVHGSTKSIVACLRNLRGSDLVKMQILFLDKWPLTLSLFRPVIEDEYQKEEPFLTEMPEEAYQKGIVDRIPWVCGHSEDEGYTFLLSHVALGTFGNLRKEWSTLAADFFNYDNLPIDQDEITRRLNWLYFRHIKPSSAPIKIYSDALGSRLIYTGIHKALQAHCQIAETYAFMFGYNGKYNLAKSAGIKPSDWAVGHGEILGYILNSTNMYAGFQKDDSELTLSNILVNLVYNFARNQVPGFTTEKGENFHVWNPVKDPRNISFLHIDKKIKMITEPYLEQILYWESLGLPDSLPLANFSNEIQNISSDPDAKGFVSTDITVTGHAVPDDLVPPIDLTPGSFANENLTATNGSTSTEKYSSLASVTVLSEQILGTTLTTASTTTTSTTSTTTILTTMKPNTTRWLAQDFVPMPDEPPLKLNQSNGKSSQKQQQLKTNSTLDPNLLTNFIDTSNYDVSSKKVPYGISVPIIPAKSNDEGAVTKSSKPYYLNPLEFAKTMLSKSFPTTPNETMMTISSNFLNNRK